MKKSKKSVIDPISLAIGRTEKFMPSPEYVVPDSEIISKIQALADIDERDRDGRTLLMFAALNERKSVAAYLIERGADVNAADNIGFTPLHFAVQDHSDSVLELLLASGANVNAQDSFGNIPLMKANMQTPLSVFEILLKHGADPMQKNNYGIAPLDVFASREDTLSLMKSYIKE